MRVGATGDRGQRGGGQVGYYVGSDSLCHPSLTDDITVDLGGQRVTLPDAVVVSVALNTTSWGYLELTLRPTPPSRGPGGVASSRDRWVLR